MRRIIYFVATSLDGFIARSNGAIDWLFTDQDYGFSTFFAGIDTVLLGRKTYEQTLEFGEYPYQDKESFIFSHSKDSFRHGIAVHQSILEFAAHLQSKPGKDIWLVGGGELAGAFFAAKVVDELIVYVHPILLGSGLPLASSLPGDVVLRFEAAEPFETGLVKLRYTVAERESPG
jgi:dihydrofolate reductase